MLELKPIILAEHWSNKNHKYLKRYDDWKPLCVKCHANYDKEFNNKFNYKNYGKYNQ